MKKRKVEVAVISDVHLGTYGCHAKELLDYLSSIKPKILVLNGDIIDIWQFRKSYFPSKHLEVIKKIISMSTKGTKVYYITGNHDEFLRKFTDLHMGNISLIDKLVLELDHKRAWIFHGDVFDVFINYSPFIARLGGKGYDFLILLNRFINKLRVAMGMARMSFAHKVKYRVKEAIKFIHDFEETAIRLAAEHDYDYVICGHIHQPVIRTVNHDQKAVCYMNSGDWVENLTALEYRWGQWSLYEYHELDFIGESREDQDGPEEPQNFTEILSQLTMLSQKSPM